jgi:hypothetical protein
MSDLSAFSRESARNGARQYSEQIRSNSAGPAVAGELIALAMPG